MNKHTTLLLPLCLLSACQSLPALDGRSVSHYVDAAAAPRLESALRPAEAERQNSGIYLLDDAHDAFVARATLIESADHALDIQYYIWHNDVSGNLLFNMLYRAADRGVRVRLLLDDNNTNGMDNILAALNHHANIEIRLFNPLFTKENPDDVKEGQTWEDNLNPESMVKVTGYLEPSLRDIPIGQAVQFERVGYFCPDTDSTPEHPVFNRTVTLKDSWAKINK